MNFLFQLYRNAFGGLSRPAWMLALVIFINRSGTMVVPFLGVYLSSELGFSLAQTGWVLSMFGLGSITGSFLGGHLTDKIGHFRVQTFSLFIGGLLFLVLSQVTRFQDLIVAIFIVSVVTEMLRPANQISVASYAKPENVTRAISLNRMAINLGFSVGPALGGFLAGYSYEWLFIADGLTCMAAGIVFFFYFRNRKPNVVEHKQNPNPALSIWKDRRFLAFVLLVTSFGTLFFQLFMTWPIYYRTVFLLPESQIGLLLGLNGMIVFLFEMILVYKIGSTDKLHILIAIGSLLSGVAFFFLFGFETIWALYVAVIFLSFSEILAMPFMATYTVNHSPPTARGRYMGLYAMAFASAFVLAPAIGTFIIAKIGYVNWWLIAGALSVINAIGFYFLLMARENYLGKNKDQALPQENEPAII